MGWVKICLVVVKIWNLFFKNEQKSEKIINPNLIDKNW